MYSGFLKARKWEISCWAQNRFWLSVPLTTYAATASFHHAQSRTRAAMMNWHATTVTTCAGGWKADSWRELATAAGGPKAGLGTRRQEQRRTAGMCSGGTAQPAAVGFKLRRLLTLFTSNLPASHCGKQTQPVPAAANLPGGGVIVAIELPDLVAILGQQLTPPDGVRLAARHPEEAPRHRAALHRHHAAALLLPAAAAAGSWVMVLGAGAGQESLCGVLARALVRGGWRSNWAGWTGGRRLDSGGLAAWSGGSNGGLRHHQRHAAPFGWVAAEGRRRCRELDGAPGALAGWMIGAEGLDFSLHHKPQVHLSARLSLTHRGPINCPF